MTLALLLKMEKVIILRKKNDNNARQIPRIRIPGVQAAVRQI